VHARPANPFVARFIGGSNILAGWLDGDRLVLGDGTAIRLAGAPRGTGEARLALRPDSVRLGPPSTAACIEGTIELSAWLGSVVEHVVRIAPDVTLLARAPGLGPDAARRHTEGERVALRWDAEDELLFDAGGRALGANKKETGHA
jgi:putative spermidine/putrescine transport system ATP-binding protein